MCSPQGGKKQTCGHVASLQGHSQAASKDRHTELFKCPCPGCLVHVCVCGYSYKIVKHPPSPPISSHMNKYMHKDFGEVTCLWQLHLSVWGRIVLESHKVNDTKYPPPLSFSSPRFSFSICHKLFSPTPLWPRSPSCLPLIPSAFLPQFCRFIFLPLSWHSSREYCWDFWSIQRDSWSTPLSAILIILSLLPAFIRPSIPCEHFLLPLLLLFFNHLFPYEPCFSPHGFHLSSSLCTAPFLLSLSPSLLCLTFCLYFSFLLSFFFQLSPHRHPQSFSVPFILPTSASSLTLSSSILPPTD